MAKKVIQVPMDEDLLAALDVVSRKEDRPRAEVIRDACWRFLQQRELEQWDREYEEGYRRIPEDPTLAEAAATVVGEVLGKETW